MLIAAICSSVMQVPVWYAFLLSWELTTRPVRVDVEAM